MTAFGTDLLALPPHRRARWGLRRSFQTEQVVDDLIGRGQRAGGPGSAAGCRGASRRRRWRRRWRTSGLRNRAETPGAELNGLDRRMTEIAKAWSGGRVWFFSTNRGPGWTIPRRGGFGR